METIIVFALILTLFVGVVALGFVFLKFYQEKKKNDILSLRDKQQSDTIHTFETKLRSLAPNKLSFVDKIKHDFKIKEMLSGVANNTEGVFCATGCLFHNGGHIPTQLSMIYEECNHNDHVPHEVMVNFQGIRTNKMYQQIFTLLDSPYLKIDNVENEDYFSKLLKKSSTDRYLAFCIKYDSKTPVMFFGVHLTKEAQLTEEFIESIRTEIETVREDVINLFAYKLKN